MRLSSRARWLIGVAVAATVVACILLRSAVSLILAASIAAITLIIGAVTILPQRVIDRRVAASAVQGLTPEDRLKAENDVRTSLLQGITAFVLIVGWLFTLVQLLNTQKATQAQLRLTERGQVSDRFTKAISQLADDRPDIRFGGIYGLDKIAQDSHDYADPSLRVLISFVRRRVPRAIPPPKSPAHLTPDERAAMEISARIARSIGRTADLTNVYLGGAGLSGVDLSGVDLSGVDLSGAILTNADLTPADLHGMHLSGAHLHGAHLQADLHDADLFGADLTGAILTNADLTPADLHGADLSGAHLLGADLTLAHLHGADLTLADLSDADLTWAKLDRADLIEARFVRTDLSTARDLTQQQLDSARGDSRTKLPAGLQRPAHWSAAS